MIHCFQTLMNIIKRTRRSSDIVIKKNHDSSCFTQGMAFYNGYFYICGKNWNYVYVVKKN